MIETTLPLQYLGTYSGVLKLGYSDYVTSGCYIQRNTLDASAHYSSTDPIVYHPNYSFIMENRNLHHFLTGRWELYWEWDLGDFTSEEIDTFISVAGIDVNPSVSSIVKTDTRLTVVHEGITSDLTEWTSVPFPWGLASRSGGLKAVLDGSKIFCCTILNNDYVNHTIRCIDIQPNESFVITKEGLEYTYVVFNKVGLVKDGTALEAFKPYKITSDSITVINTSTEAVRVLRIVK